MVVFNFSKLMSLVAKIQATPVEVAKRNEKLLQFYFELESKTEDEVRIYMGCDLERLVERHIDLEDPQRQLEILNQLVCKFTNSKIGVPDSSNLKKYLIPAVEWCLSSSCTSKLSLCRPSKTENTVPIYTESGRCEGEVYRKSCPTCTSIYYYCYWEYDSPDGNFKIRKYYNKKMEFFSLTNETFYESALLENLNESIVTMNVQFTNWVDAYNRLKSVTVKKMSYKSVIPAWLLYMVFLKIGLTFPVVRDPITRNLDVEATCSSVYADYKASVDADWLKHKCHRCTTRLVVLDGDCKAYRNVCAANVVKSKSYGELNEFTACSQSPMPGKSVCEKHNENESQEPIERTDLSVITRSRRREMGLSIDQLTSGEGCRKLENINQRTDRKKTAGMLYAYRSCGISLGHMELIHSGKWLHGSNAHCIKCILETCTAFQLLLFEIFGEFPSPQELTGIVIDRGIVTI